MGNQDADPRFPSVGDGSGLEQTDRFFREEVQLASRNRGMPLEGLRYDVTPTGMHYLLVHFDIPEIDPRTWTLEVGGLVETTMSLTLDEIRWMPAETVRVTMECAGNGRALLSPRPISQPWMMGAVGTAEWKGTPLGPLLKEAGVRENAAELLFSGRDRGVQGDEVHYYQRSMSIEEASRDEVILAYEMNGEPLQPQHGSPLRLVAPGWYGMASVKWLGMIDAIPQTFEGYQVGHAYRYTQSQDEPGEPVTFINVRALMVPPGIPDFLTRGRLVQPGSTGLTGRAWAGRRSVSKVEVSVDGGSAWSEALLNPQTHEFAWQAWSFDWDATSGRHTLTVRATDSEGNVQPVDQPWNYQGMGNNMAQRVDVFVE